MHPDPNASPFNSLPRGVIVLALLIGGIEVIFQLAATGLVQGWSGNAMRLFAWAQLALPSETLYYVAETGRAPLDLMKRFLTYALVHENFVHALFVIVFVLALGKMVGEAFNSLAVLLLFFVATLAGGIFHCLITPGAGPLVGGYPGAYGLIGGFTLILWIGYGRVGENQYRAFTLIGVLLAVQFLFGLLGASTRWVSELAGFATGFLTATLMIPGAFRHMMRRIRNR